MNSPKFDEAQLTAHLLGQLKPEEAAAVREAMERDPELAELSARLSRTMGLVAEALATPAGQIEPLGAPLRLAPARRERVLQSFKTVTLPKPPPVKRPLPWFIPMSAAAVLVALISALAFLPEVRMGSRTKSLAMSQRSLERTESLLRRSEVADDKRRKAPTAPEPAMPNVMLKRASPQRPGSLAASANNNGVESGPQETAPTDAAERQIAGKSFARFSPVLPPESQVQSTPVIDAGSARAALDTTERLSELKQAIDAPVEIPVASAVTGLAATGGGGGFGGGGGLGVVGRSIPAENEQLGNAATADFFALPPANAPASVTPAQASRNQTESLRVETDGARPSSRPAAVPTLGDTPALGQRFRKLAEGVDVAGSSRGYEQSAIQELRRGTPALTPGAPAAEMEPILAQREKGLSDDDSALKRRWNFQNDSSTDQKEASPNSLGFLLARKDTGGTLPPEAGQSATVALDGLTASPPAVTKPEVETDLALLGLAVEKTVESKAKSDLSGGRMSVRDSEETEVRAKLRQEVASAQPEVLTSDNRTSTFSLNVTDVSFRLAAASLAKGQLPDPASVRSEEFLNAFDYRDPEPANGAAVGFAWERARSPFAQNRDLLRFGVKTAARGRQAGRPLNLVLLLDRSGSMERADRVRIVEEALRVLGHQLRAEDRLSVITFARTPRLWADGVPGSEAGQALERAANITPEGGTNLDEALRLAYETARKHQGAASVNRVVLLTDGAANLGDVDPNRLRSVVETNRLAGLALDCFGVGWEGLDDNLLQDLSSHGDGRYGFLNSPEEAATGFAGQLAGALQVAAANVKVQVEFNPERVKVYRQVGYAKHQLKKEQFRDNTVDAAEIGAAESGNALYVLEVNPAGQGPIGQVRVRYQVPGTEQYQEQEWTVPYAGSALPLDQSSPALRLAAVSAGFSEWLASSPYGAEASPERLLPLLQGVAERFGSDPRPGQLETMIRQAQTLGK